jgi:fido (protein-threonine AMPylation protein)
MCSVSWRDLAEPGIFMATGQRLMSRRVTLITYANYCRISADVEMLAAQFALENNLKGLTKPQFGERMAYYLNQFNHVHPFQEGNGHTIQAVLLQLGHPCGLPDKLR